MPRYTTTGIPPHIAEVGLSAFMPHYVRLAASGAQAFKGQVTGHPGTAAIRIHPRAQGVPPSPDPGDISQMGTSRSSDAPDAIWPNLYYDNPAAQGPDGQRYYPGAGMPIQVNDPVAPWLTTMIPVPAIDLRSIYQGGSAHLAGGIDNDRKGVLRQAAQFIQWPRRTRGNGPGTGSP